MSDIDREVIFDCSSIEKVFEVLVILCKTTGHFCYDPNDFSEAILSLTWAETLQYVSEDCINDAQCALNTLRSFMESLSLALSRKYVIKIDIDRIKDILKKFEFNTYNKVQYV